MSWFIDVVSSLGVLGMSTGGWLSFSQESKVKNTIGSKHSFFMKGLFRISKIKTFNSSTDEATVNFSPAVVIKAGETKTLTAKINTAATGNFAVELVSVDANATVEGANIVANEF